LNYRVGKRRGMNAFVGSRSASAFYNPHMGAPLDYTPLRARIGMKRGQSPPIPPAAYHSGARAAEHGVRVLVMVHGRGSG
jgi:hypothetical protein